VWNVRTRIASHRSPSMGGVKGQATSGANRQGESTDTQGRDGAAHSSVEGPMGLEPRGCVVQPWPWGQLETGRTPFLIPKWEVWEAFRPTKERLA
jgi:hypothetical protein